MVLSVLEHGKPKSSNNPSFQNHPAHARSLFLVHFCREITNPRVVKVFLFAAPSPAQSGQQMLSHTGRCERFLWENRRRITKEKGRGRRTRRRVVVSWPDGFCELSFALPYIARRFYCILQPPQRRSSHELHSAAWLLSFSSLAPHRSTKFAKCRRDEST